MVNGSSGAIGCPSGNGAMGCFGSGGPTTPDVTRDITFPGVKGCGLCCAAGEVSVTIAGISVCPPDTLDIGEHLNWSGKIPWNNSECTIAYRYATWTADNGAQYSLLIYFGLGTGVVGITLQVYAAEGVNPDGSVYYDWVSVDGGPGDSVFIPYPPFYAYGVTLGCGTTTTIDNELTDCSGAGPGGAGGVGYGGTITLTT